ncbi:uncharacterized protein EV420DRAFT_915021 [Desarmillaria tabescens]|uniref:Uncharacterized protein n=1 Tax=Armillaria tabescens TaxID=1929756 RepID=A0AA39MTX4_ARMTA|nr:uncharacterized protein EV420DRAFT_915021 [Desarmillaria tabescens]KAK0446058.1 hypothetical protein EV420DRAFT_915021 [Desarmillaria tabescens]
MGWSTAAAAATTPTTTESLPAAHKAAKCGISGPTCEGKCFGPNGHDSKVRSISAVLYSFINRFLVSRAQVYGEENSDDDAPHTPWIWNPRGLVEKEDEQGLIQAEYCDAHGNRFLQSRGPTPTRRRSSLEHEAPPSPSPLRLQRHTSTRQSSEPSPQIYAAVPAPRRGASEPPVTQLSSYSQQSRHSSPEPRQPQQQDHRPLQPTFSTNIVRIPGHYNNNSPTRPSSAATSPGHISRKSSRSSSVDAELAAKMDRLSTGAGPTQPLARTLITTDLLYALLFVNCSCKCKCTDLHRGTVGIAEPSCH